MEYELKKLAELKKFVLEEFEELEELINYAISDDNKNELILDSNFIISNSINKLEILQSNHHFLNKVDTIKANRLLFLVNKIIRDIEV